MARRVAALLAILVFATVAVGGCGGSGGQAEESTEQSTALQTTTAPGTTIAPETTASGPGPDPDSCPDDAQYVSSQSNIFGAGSELVMPAPGGGGGGEPPAFWKLPASAKVVSFPLAEGEVTPISSGVNERGLNGPGGDGIGPTNIESYGGISGLVHRKNGMFLTGVFLGRKAPADPAPPRLDFSKGEKFKLLSPKIGQTFFIGDGRGRTYRVPADATRLFLGFVDGAFYQGMPGFYSNNAGGLCVQMAAG